MMRKKKIHPIYASNPNEAIDYANRFVGIYLQKKITRLENYLGEKDIRKKLMEELEWAKQELARR